MWSFMAFLLEGVVLGLDDKKSLIIVTSSPKVTLHTRVTRLCIQTCSNV